jgi:phospholipid/cholesterol/gamma-HCH transport system permease protein
MSHMGRDWIASFGAIGRFCVSVMAAVLNGPVFRFFGEALRQAGILVGTRIFWSSNPRAPIGG